MSDSDRRVPRGDNDLDGAPDMMKDEQGTKISSEPTRHDADESADQRAHGTHGRGRGAEERIDATVPKPDGAKDSDRGGSSAWGSESSGGSSMDK
ncbi:MAG TPA: hypothetical protein VHB25_10575 [Gemmatimonadaceae bacterium]|nr:hypothetical protein [Gemmatimonadaceae bacterium]